MSCRHNSDSFGFKTDPACSSYRSVKERRDAVEKYLDKLIIGNGIKIEPDNSKYEIIRAQEVGEYLLLRVKYDSCNKCAGEAEKIMVFKATTLEALRWRVIDPHFRDARSNANAKSGPPSLAPSPLARFFPDDDGWSEAVDYALRSTDPKPF